MDEDNDAPSQDVLELQRTKNIQALVDGRHVSWALVYGGGVETWFDKQPTR